MSQPTDSLLQPSLSTERPATAIYSTQATFFTSFFGGHLAALAIGALNARHMGRLREDAPRLIGLLLASLLAVAGLAFWASDGGVDKRTMRYAIRFLGLAVWGVLYLLHKPVYRAAELAEAGHRPAWGAGIACVALAAVLHYGYAQLVIHLLVTP